MRFHKLRIVRSVGCSLACLLLLVLWLRSYWWQDGFVHYEPPGRATISLWSGRGGVSVSTDYYPPFPFSVQPAHWRFYSSVIDPDEQRQSLTPFALYANTGGGSDVLVPFWPPILICAALASLPWFPWLRWRFSLRTLLFTTTIIAVALGTIVWFSR